MRQAGKPSRQRHRHVVCAVRAGADYRHSSVADIEDMGCPPLHHSRDDK
jgi:hypothetical protein